MTENDAHKFSVLITDVLGFYKQDTSKFTMKVWWGACQRFDYEQVARALEAHAMSPDRGQFPPKPADIVRQLEGTQTDKSAVAWGKAHDAAGTVGAYQDAVFDDPLIHVVIDDLGGWPKFCRTETAELGYLQHRFCESYRAYAARSVLTPISHPARLSGDRSPDYDYFSRGLKLPRPMLIGNPEKAMQVYKTGGNSANKTQISIGNTIKHIPVDTFKLK